jgi:hypothetical protein
MALRVHGPWPTYSTVTEWAGWGVILNPFILPLLLWLVTL